MGGGNIGYADSGVGSIGTIGGGGTKLGTFKAY